MKRASGAVGRAEDQVDVVRHEAVGVEGHSVSRAIRGEPVEIGLVVAVPQEHRLPAVAAGDDVIEKPRAEDAWSPGHAF